MESNKVIELIGNVGTAITSHYSALRQESLGIEMYSSAKKRERVEILKLLKEDLEEVLRGGETTEMLDAIVSQCYTQVLGMIRSMEVIRELNTTKKLDSLEYDRDLVDMRTRLSKQNLYNESLNQDRAVPSYLMEA